jgi:hypothetical protein
MTTAWNGSAGTASTNGCTGATGAIRPSSSPFSTAAATGSTMGCGTRPGRAARPHRAPTGRGTPPRPGQRYATLIAELRWRVQRVTSDYGEDGPEAEQVRAVGAALEWFAAADEAALRADGLIPRTGRATVQRGRVVSRCCPPERAIPAWRVEGAPPRLPDGDRRHRQGRQGHRRRGRRRGRPVSPRPRPPNRSPGPSRNWPRARPALALAVGAELHWLDADRYRETSRDLLIGAYQALGRHAQADIHRGAYGQPRSAVGQHLV